MLSPLTKEQVEKIFKNATVKFSAYYKYSFSFEGEHEGYAIYCCLGGEADSIYRLEVDTEPKSFLPLEQWDYIKITDKQGNVVYKKDNWW